MNKAWFILSWIFAELVSRKFPLWVVPLSKCTLSQKHVLLSMAPSSCRADTVPCLPSGLNTCLHDSCVRRPEAWPVCPEGRLAEAMAEGVETKSSKSAAGTQPRVTHRHFGGPASAPGTARRAFKGKAGRDCFGTPAGSVIETHFPTENS